MCGRFTLTCDAVRITVFFQLATVPKLRPRYNIAPSQLIATIVQQEQEAKQLRLMKWGLIPGWAKDPKIGHRLINARAETLSEKPSFRSAFKRRRCLIVADGFYEWQQTKTGKQPYYIQFKNQQLFAFAGLWEIWHSEKNEEIESCSIITTKANELIKPIHHRMPVILSPNTYSQWLDPTVTSIDKVQSFLAPYDSADMEVYQVSEKVNRSTYDQPDCFQSI
ncbi:MAG: SOS response-associated peptidase [Cyanobacteria bacterium P01_G01_bin.49]